MTFLTEIRNKLASLIGRSEGFDEEIRLHMEARADELELTGMPRRDAELQARRELGNATLAAEDSRGAWRFTWIDDLFRDLHHAARTLARDRGFAAAGILSLALGIGLNTTIFSLTNEFLFREPSVRDAGTLLSARVGGFNGIPMAQYKALGDAKVFDGLVGASPMQEVNWRIGDASLRLFATRVTDNFFEVTGVPIAIGRAIANGEREVAVVSHPFWESRLNHDPGVIGKVLTLDGKRHVIVGVLPSGHRTLTGFGYSPDLYLPIDTEKGTGVALYGRLGANDTAAGALGRLKTASLALDRMFPGGNYKWSEGVAVIGMSGFERLNDGFLRTVTAFFGMLMAVVGLLLMIACGNVASLLLARGSARGQEFAIRMSIGAGRGRLIRQMLAESLLLSVTGAAAGLAINLALTSLLNDVVLPLPFPVKLNIAPDLRLVLYAGIVAIGSALVAGILPAIKSTRVGTSALLKTNEHQVSGRRMTLRNLLVAGQLAISVIVLVMATLAIRNLTRAATLNPGFDLQNTSWAQMRFVPENFSGAEKVQALIRSALEELHAVPGVTAATVAGFVPLNDHFSTRTLSIYMDQTSEGKRVEHWWNAVGPEYFATMGIEIRSGREFTTLDRRGAQRVVILNEAMARTLFGGENPLGRELRFGRDDKVSRTVVGVARNSKYSSLGEQDRPAIYEPYYQAGAGRGGLNLLVRTSQPPDTLSKAVASALLKIDPTSSVEVKPMSRATAFALLPSRAGALMLGSVGFLGLALASVGLYGVLAYSITRRTREIGLRVALGARREEILRLVLKEAGWIVGLGLIVGILIALAITRPLTRFLVPGLSTSDPATYATVAFVLLLVGAMAALTPALRALRIDPMTALRYE